MQSKFRLGRTSLIAALIVGAAAALRWLAPEYIEMETTKRLLGLLLGAVVVFYANTVPKLIVSQSRHSPAVGQALRRFTGWALALGGIGYMLAWLVAPLDMANPIAGAVLASALLMVVIRCLLARKLASS